MADCEWCPLISGCLPKDYVQCTDNAVCYTGNQACKSNCRLSSCTGTNASCGCSLGECTICKADEACTNNYCISALLPMCIPNWVCGDWSVCNAFGEQARICTDYNACGSLENKPLTIMSCTYAAAETGVNTEFDSGTEETETSEKEPETESPSTIEPTERGDRKSTRLNSSHGYISYAVFCLKNKRTPAVPATHPQHNSVPRDKIAHRQHI